MNKRNEVIVQKDKKLHQLFAFESKIGNGCFGHIYLVVNKKTDNRAALKVELLKRNDVSQTLNLEYQILKKLEGISGIPHVYSYGRGDSTMYLELELLGKDLYSKFTEGVLIDDNFICRAARELIQILSQVHQRKVLHRDLKPQNIMLDENMKFYLIDFGISEVFNHRKPRNEPLNFVGTPRYASINAHRGIPLKPIDDIESLMYVLIFIYKRDLPWISLNIDEKNKIQVIRSIKQKKPKKQLCRGMPICFYECFEHLKAMKEDGVPDYKYLIKLFEQRLQRFEYSLKQLTATSEDLVDIVRILEDERNRRCSIQEAGQLLAVPFVKQITTKGSSLLFSEKAFGDVENENDEVNEGAEKRESVTVSDANLSCQENQENEPTLEQRVRRLYLSPPKLKPSHKDISSKSHLNLSHPR